MGQVGTTVQEASGAQRSAFGETGLQRIYKEAISESMSRENVSKDKSKEQVQILESSLPLFPRSAFSLTQWVKPAILINVSSIRSKIQLICYHY